MAQLRNAFRAYALDYASPAEITRRLARHVPDGDMVTIVCMTLDPYTRRFGYSLAGHPPILVLDRATASVTLLGEAGAPPLGFASAESIREAWRTLPASAAIVAYTDGLVERRGAVIDEGIGRVAAVLAEAGDQPAEQLADAILATAVDVIGKGDDSALLVIDAPAVPAQVNMEIPAAAELMSPLRHRLDAWMTLRGIDRQQRLDSVLALHEACINAMEHGYQLDEAPSSWP
jgi:serine phosphatase RsbU (regulator of sigma subunit)